MKKTFTVILALAIFVTGVIVFGGNEKGNDPLGSGNNVNIEAKESDGSKATNTGLISEKKEKEATEIIEEPEGSAIESVDKTNRRYEASSVRDCTLVDYQCNAGEKSFRDETGCGCEKINLE